MSGCDLPVPLSPMRQSGCPALTQAEVASWWITTGLTQGWREVEVVHALVAGEPGIVDAPAGAAVPVVTFGHHQLGEEAEP
jgi:hypothetical protein